MVLPVLTDSMLLQPYRILDLTGPLGFSCGKILADLGADVIKIEPPGGDPARRLPPLLGGGCEPPLSLCWLAFNANKRGITLNLFSRHGRDAFLRLEEKADFVIESFSPGTIGDLQLSYDRLRGRNPGLILVSITPFGQHGPYRSFKSSDLEIMALGGAMSLAGEADSEPMRVTEPQAPMWVGAEAAMGALTALVYRSASGRGQHVDVSAQVAVMAALAHAPTFWDLHGINPERAGVYVTGRSLTGSRMRVFWRCRDGWINFILYGGAAGRHSNEQLVAWMTEHGAAPVGLQRIDWGTFDITNATQQEVDAIETPIGQFFATLTKQRFFGGVVQREILGYPVFTPQEISADPHLQARGFWQDVADPSSVNSLRYPGAVPLINGARPPVRRPAPLIGQHNREILVDELGLSMSELSQFQIARHV